MKTIIINLILKALQKVLTPDMLKAIVKQGLEALKEYAAGTDNEFDDKLVAWLADFIVEAFDL